MNMKRSPQILRTILAIALITPYLSLTLPKISKVEAAGKGNCAAAYYEDHVTGPQGTIVKDETWTDSDLSKAFTVANDKSISVVFIKSGSKEGFCLDPITEDGSYNNDHFIVSGIGTNSVTVTENGGQDVSHTEFVVTTANPDPACVTGTRAWAYSVVEADQNGTTVAANRSDVSDVLGQTDSVPGAEETFYSLGLGGFITISFEYPVVNVTGNDVEIFEITWGDRTGYPEASSVEVSPDGVLWAKIADINNQSIDGVSSIAFESSNFEWIKYVRITDTTKTIYPTSPSADGFDIDAISGISGTCGEIDEENLNWGVIRGYKCEDLDGDGDFMVGHYTDTEAEEAAVYERCVRENLGLNDWTINLYEVVNGEEILIDSENTATGENGKNGYYEFSGLDINKLYRLREVENKAGWLRTRPSELNFGRDYHIVNFANVYKNRGAFLAGRNFGNYRITESTVSLCKSDEKGNMLPGWNLSLRANEASAEVEVPSNETTVSMNLEAGNYVLVANGTYTYGNWGDGSGIADAGYSLRTPGQSYSYHTETIPTWVSGDNLTGWEGYLEVRVANTNANWGDFNNDHVYELAYTHAGGNLNFTTIDSYYGDNSGTINVKAYRIYDGVTEEDGCVEFENVNFGNYSVGETINDSAKWVNVSGLSDVTVDDIEERFVVVNNYIDPVDLVIEKSETDEDNTVLAGDALTYTIRYANVGEDTAHNVFIKETVPAGTTYTGSEGWICDATPAVAGTVCTYTVGDLVGQNTTAEIATYQTVNFTVTVNADVTAGTLIANTAVIESDEDEEITNNNTDNSDTVTVAGGNEDDEDQDDDDQDVNDYDGEVEGETTGPKDTEEKKDVVLGVAQTNPILQTFNPSVLGASTQESLARTGSTVAWAVASLGLMAVIGSTVALLKKKK